MEIYAHKYISCDIDTMESFNEHKLLELECIKLEDNDLGQRMLFRLYEFRHRIFKADYV